VRQGYRSGAELSFVNLLDQDEGDSRADVEIC
jgi:hypothetical protein